MNQKHAEEILKVLQEWFSHGEVGPQAGSLVFDDHCTLKEHVDAALKGHSIEYTSVLVESSTAAG